MESKCVRKKRHYDALDDIMHNIAGHAFSDDDFKKSKYELEVVDAEFPKGVISMEETLNNELPFLSQPRNCQWRAINAENLNLEYSNFYNEKEADMLMSQCEKEIIYNVGELAKVQMFGKWIDIPRKQVAYGDEGLTYTFSGKTLPARPWTSLLLKIRDQIYEATGYTFNFVLINRYKDGNDYIGEHKDDEKELYPGYPIASLTLGQLRDFVFKHQDSRRIKALRNVGTITLQLEHGSLLLMKHPTNSYWYHSLPRRKKAIGVRLNLTFRRMEPSKCKAA
ncbi:Alpha-ketoglutarate-dependent dioxygenase alkB 2 [Biomphalaria glabrata]|uniref:DNA oxidative demethylase ALKBH2 n=3 Tax=Biomphalaria TaxID=6525 RepID=A0A9W2YIZ8_BIOGL|nr:DNA oxidative demethylase ALKBH2-like [Biomphalaria glabrata]KAI8749176.1 alpha-ketoglutarate-dependent dioxygenase alkB 2 [Biomphalaria glabrata]KAI8753720.1 alpha-ketoglutarate-dependent dioxygenase alkB-like protein 2-like [Biomphalaria glabrata]KAK0058737.1 alpha-ketoglutarate-dependent dioxygenase alkB 2 [Biomphalaria pfeifferi]